MRKVLLLLVMVINVFAFSFFDAKPEGQCNRVDYFVTIKDLVVATQKTRGLTNSYLNGNVAAQLLVYGQRTKMKQALKSLSKHHKDKVQIVDKATQLRVEELANKIKVLNKTAFKLDSAKAFEEYTKVINETLLITQNMVKVNCDECEPLAKDSVDLMVTTLLPLTENIGKTRGLGSGVVARGFSKKEESQKLQDFITEIEKLSIKMELEMNQLIKRYPKAFTNSVKVTKKDLDLAIAKYVKITQEKVINQQDIQLDANIYFDQGSAVISEVLKLYKMNRDAIRYEK